MKSVFWFSLFFVIYTYVGYPLLIYFMSLIRSKLIQKEPITPTISVVISALNEERNIKTRIDNILAQDYPKDRIEIVVVSDGSTDRTEEMLRSYELDNIRVFPRSIRQGKASSLNQGITEASGEIIVFTDARQVFAPDAIKNLASNFKDPAVGCVSGELIFVNDKGHKIN